MGGASEEKIKINVGKSMLTRFSISKVPEPLRVRGNIQLEKEGVQVPGFNNLYEMKEESRGELQVE